MSKTEQQNTTPSQIADDEIDLLANTLAREKNSV